MATLPISCRCGSSQVICGKDLTKMTRQAQRFQKQHTGDGHSFSAQASPTRRRQKFGNRIVELDGHKFDSQREAKRYSELKLLVRAGEIKDLKLQVPFECRADGELIETYVADFTYSDRTGALIVEDAKGCITPTYRRKRRWMKSLHGITIKET